ncbi:MAG TPA: hypothetical protein PKE63_05810 [Lacibacter sp.]|nr:hypothetical protein [Lacibacter sp.]HMO88713.1 hypothetical protein [Lacibacter sp.]HMP86773.1 hypothetical protein [Lacibacter sp.]
MSKQACILLLAIGLAWSCGGKNKKATNNFIDVAGYLKGQLAYLDTVPHGFLRITGKDGIQTDSSYLKKEDVQQLAAVFIIPQLEKKQLEQDFEETVFADATLQTITITYQPINGNNPVRRIDLYIRPENGQISQLYLVKEEEAESRQLLWRHNEGFTTITTRNMGVNSQTITEKIIWQ